MSGLWVLLQSHPFLVARLRCCWPLMNVLSVLGAASLVVVGVLSMLLMGALAISCGRCSVFVEGLVLFFFGAGSVLSVSGVDLGVLVVGAESVLSVGVETVWLC